MFLISNEVLFALIFISFFSYCMNPNKVDNILLHIHKSMMDYMDSMYYLFSDELVGDDANYDWDEDNTDEEDVKDEEVIEDEKVKLEVKYENKYLTEIRKMEKEFIFDDTEKALEEQKFTEIYNTLINNYQEKEEKEKEKEKDVKEETKVCHNDILEKAKEQARQFIIDEKLNKLKDCFVMEKTPLGNVLMFYNHNRDSFEFYSDNTIPYRYLESVGRKYVKMFNCRPIFVDMEEELKLCEERLEKLQKEKEVKEALKLEEKLLYPHIEPKKSVFAKFKSYNKEAGTGRVNMAAPPKNSISNQPVTEKDSNEVILLKENANRYTYEGKFSNFNFLKKVERKVVDQKFRMTFADYKLKHILTKTDNNSE